MLGLTGFDYYYKAVQQHPEWIREAKELGLKTNVWTVNDTSVMQWLIAQEVDFITTDKSVELNEVLKNKLFLWFVFLSFCLYVEGEVFSFRHKYED